MFSEIRAINEQIARLQAQRDALFQEKRREAVAQARALVDQFGLTPAQVDLSSMSRTVLEVKSHRPTTFYDPNRGLSWNGELKAKGRKPTWIQAAIADGSIEKYRVKTGD